MKYYILWNDDNQEFFKETYDNIVDARKSAYRRKCRDVKIYCINGRNSEYVGTVFNKRNKRDKVSYIDNSRQYYLNPDGSLGKKVD